MTRRKSRRPQINWSITQLPTWKVERARKPGYVKVTCPRRDCGLVIWVNRLDWLRASTYPTRPCIGCFKTSQLPKEVLDP